jgi:hypothetical protein
MNVSILVKAACQDECKYAAMKQKNLIFVMMDAAFTPGSAPDAFDGWFASLIGSRPWYSLFEDADVERAARDIALIMATRSGVGHAVVASSAISAAAAAPIAHLKLPAPLEAAHRADSEHADSDARLDLIYLYAWPLAAFGRGCDGRRDYKTTVLLDLKKEVCECKHVFSFSAAFIHFDNYQFCCPICSTKDFWKRSVQRNDASVFVRRLPLLAAFPVLFCNATLF